MRNLGIDIAYDGTNFFGWQRQPDKPTLQACIETAIERLTGERVRLTGAGRTDAGVHAAGQVANFRLKSLIPCENLNRALNHILPESVRVLRVREMDSRFHARYDAIAKVYRYRILQSRVCPPFLARYVFHYPNRLDVEQMARAARQLEGEHDFTSFAAANSRPAGQAEDEDTPGGAEASVRHIFNSRIAWNPRTSILTYEVRGNGFLRYMVRNIIGTLIDVGRGATFVHEIPSILAARDRTMAGPTAPARGLCLVRVEY